MIKHRITKPQTKSITSSEKKGKRKYWSNTEDDILKQTVSLHGSNWIVIAEYLEGRNASQCAQRWKRVKPENEKNRQRWDKEEDDKLKQLIQEYNCNWKAISQFLPHRTGRQIRERYINHLDPNICSRAWTHNEDQKIWKMYKRMGSKWSVMAKQLKGRPENMIKNRFYGYVRRAFTQQQNPYYIVPIQKRNLNTEQIKEININNDPLILQRKQELDCDQIANNHVERPILLNLMQQESFQKMIFEKQDNDLENPLKMLFYSDSNLNLFRHNFHEFQSNKDEYNDNQAHPFCEEMSHPMKIMHDDIYEELTKWTPAKRIDVDF